MVQAGASLSAKARGFSLLHLAASSGNSASVKFLLDHGAKVNGEQSFHTQDSQNLKLFSSLRAGLPDY